MNKDLFNTTYMLCQKWHLRPFTFLERCKDTVQEMIEVFEAIIKRRSKKEIGLEYGDVIFTIIRHGLDEKERFWSEFFFFFIPGKSWLLRKLEIYEERHEWWMKNHGFHSIRNFKNREKRGEIIKRHRLGQDGKKWIK